MLRLRHLKDIYVMSFILLGWSLVPAHGLANMNLDVKGDLMTSYDDNINSDHENEKEDIVTNLVLGLGLNQKGKTYLLHVEGDVTQEIFAEYEDFNNTEQDFSVDFSKDVSKHEKLEISNDFLHARRPRTFDDDFGRTSGQYSSYRNKFDVMYSKKITEKYGFKGGYDNEVYEVSREDMSDSLMNRMTLEMDYIRGSLSELFSKYVFSVRDYELGQEFFIHTLAGGIRQYLSKQLLLEASAGGAFIDGISMEDHSRVRPDFRVSLSDHIDDNTTLSFIYRKESRAKGYKADIFDSWQLDAKVEREINARVDLTLSGFYGEGEYWTDDTRDDYLGAGGEVGYRLNSHTKTFLSYKHTMNDSNDRTREYDRNVVSTGIKILF